ncbi:WD40 repeat-like protein, partial [Schizopora paradoxa]
RVIAAHSAAIECIAICSDGCTVLSGDDAGCIYLWDLYSGAISQEIQCPTSGGISSAIWIRSDDLGDAFVFGCVDGSIQLYALINNSRNVYELKFRAVVAGPIEDLAFNDKDKLLASVGGGWLHVWKVSSKGPNLPHASRGPEKAEVAKNVTFTNDRAGIIVFYLDSHEM